MTSLNLCPGSLILIFVQLMALQFRVTRCFSPNNAFRTPERTQLLQMIQGINSDMLNLANKMNIRIALPTRDHELAATLSGTRKKLLDATWERGMYKVRDQRTKKYTLMFPPIVIPGVDTISTSVDVEFINSGDGKICLKSTDWSIRGKSGAILRDSRFMETFQIEIAGELSIRESAVIRASAIKADTINVPAPAVIANGWVQYQVGGEKPSALRNAPPMLMDATVKIIKDISEDYATRQFTERFQSSFRSYLTAELSKRAVLANIARQKEEREGLGRTRKKKS